MNKLTLNTAINELKAKINNSIQSEQDLVCKYNDYTSDRYCAYKVCLDMISEFQDSLLKPTKKVKKSILLTCEDCGETSERVVHTICPYEHEINDTDVDCDLCYACSKLRADEM